MSKNIYVGNLPHETTKEQLQERFSEFGKVESAIIIMDKFTGKSRGFGFVKMEEDDANAAIAALNGQDFGGRTMKVSEASSRESRGGTGGPRGGGAGGGFNRGPRSNSNYRGGGDRSDRSGGGGHHRGGDRGGSMGGNRGGGRSSNMWDSGY